ncbi:MAG TPA: BatA domain-containing protein [Candidatus Cloacimonadota bacterium]|nr:BatA domain-containing protein [Candidatus Cloacimonadota bacterium]HPT72882.1 BatA domain-containing protein [Candidatus Cloacimonadota bacterium]
MFGLSFLNGSILAVAVSTIIPLLIYLFARKKPRKVEFSSIRFILASQKKQNKKINLLNILLLIIRMMIILLIVLALARPTVKSPYLKSSTQHPPTAIAIILDTSYSMNYLVDTQTNLEKGKEIISRINNMLSDQDIAILLTSDEKWNRLNGNLHFGKLPSKEMENINITYMPVPYMKLVKEAEDKLSQSQLPNREIYIITDGQKQEIPLKNEYSVFLIPTSRHLDWINLSCRDARPDIQLVNRKLTNAVSFNVVNHDKIARNDVLCRLYMDDRTIAEKFIEIAPNQSKTESFPVQLETTGWHSGYVEIQDERLTEDNRSYFSFYFDMNPKIGVITSSPTIPLALDTILQVYSGKASSIQKIDPSRVNLESSNDLSLLVVYGMKDLSPRLRQLLQAWQQQNKGVLYIADKDISKDWQSYLSAGFNLKWSSFSMQNLPITYINQYHPVTSLLSVNVLHQVQMTDFWNIKPTSESSTLLASGNIPLAMVKNNDFLWLFDIGSLRNRFLLNSGFPVFAYRTLQYMGNSHFQSPAMKLGESVQVPFITLPNGSRLELNDGRYILTAPGIYGLEEKGGKRTEIAVNQDYDESSFLPMPQIKGKNIKWLGSNWQDRILQTRFGYELWKWLLGMVLFLFIMEMLLVKYGERKSHDIPS